MKAVLDKLHQGIGPTYRIEEGAHHILIAHPASWQDAPDRKQFTVPLQLLNKDKAQEFLWDRLCSLSNDGCALVPYRIRGDDLDVGLAFAVGAQHIGEASADGTAVADAPEELALMIVDLIFVEDLMES